MSRIEHTTHSPPLLVLNEIVHRTTNDREASSYWLELNALLFIAGGNGEVSLEDSRHHASRGKCFLLRANQSLHLQNGETEPLSYFLIIFSVQQDTVGLLARNKALVFDPCSRLEDQLLELLVSSHSRHNNDENQLNDFQLHIRFQTMLYDVLHKLNSEKQGTENARQAVERTIDFLHRAYREEIEIGRLAREANMSRWRYGSLFKSLTGQTPARYLNALRIEQAKTLLASSSARINDIAARVGFRDEYYFSRRFKQTTGMSPTQFAHSRGRSPRIFSIQYLGELLALGIRPIGTNRSMLSALPEACTDVRPVDEPLNIEQLTDLNPDLILYPSFVTDELARQLKSVAPAIEIDWNSDVYTRLQQLGLLLDRAKEADEWIDRYKAKAIRAKRLLKDAVREGETASAFIVHADGLFVYAGHHFGHTLYQGLGFEPSPGVRALMERNRNAKWLEIRLEDVPQYAGDRIFFALSEQGGDARKGREMLRHPIWRNLPAVREGKSYIVKDYWANYNPVTLDKHLDDTVRRLLRSP